MFSLAPQADGRILVGGFFTTLGGQSRNRIARLNEDGTLDSGFNPGASYYVTALAVQSDGRILVGGGFSTLGGQERSRIGRLNNTEPATQSLSHDGSTITWLRGGTSPEVWRTSFEHSPDGATWSNLGAGTRIPGGWHLTGVPVPLGGLVRARGYVTGGQYNASGWFVETLWPPQPRLTDPHWLNPTTFEFTLLAETNLIYRIDSGPDLDTWSEVLRLTNPPPATPIELPIAPGQPRQFFRAVIP